MGQKLDVIREENYQISKKIYDLFKKYENYEEKELINKINFNLEKASKEKNENEVFNNKNEEKYILTENNKLNNEIVKYNKENKIKELFNKILSIFRIK